MRALPGSGWRSVPGLCRSQEFGIDRRIPGAVGRRAPERSRLDGADGQGRDPCSKLTRLLTGEASLGYQHRRYVDPTRRAIGGLVADVGLTRGCLVVSTTITLSGRQQPRRDHGGRRRRGPGDACRSRLCTCNCVAAWFCRGELGHRITRYGGAGAERAQLQPAEIGFDYRFQPSRRCRARLSLG